MEEENSELVTYLIGLKNKDDRGAMTDLRFAMSNNSRRFKSWGRLARFGGNGDNSKAKAIHTVAALFAYHPKVAETGNFGTTCFQLLSDDEKSGFPDKEGPMSKRFHHLISANEDEIFERVFRIGLFAKSKEKAINYVRLEKDLYHWANWSDQVRTRWAKQFWSRTKEVQ